MKEQAGPSTYSSESGNFRKTQSANKTKSKGTNSSLCVGKVTSLTSQPIPNSQFTIGNLILEGLLPKCTPPIHSNNPLSRRQWKQNLNHLAKRQLQLLIEETQNQITALKTILNEQLEAFQTAVYDHATYILLSDLNDNMAFNLRNSLDLRCTYKLKRILPSDTRQNTPNHPATTNSLAIVFPKTTSSGKSTTPLILIPISTLQTLLTLLLGQ